MPTDLHDELRTIATALVADAPAVPPFDSDRSASSNPRPRWSIPAAAAAVVAVGVGGLVVVRADQADAPGSDVSPPSTTAAATSTVVGAFDPQPGPTGDSNNLVPTLLPIAPEPEDSSVEPAAATWGGQLASESGPVIEALVVRRDGDRIVDGFVISAGSSFVEPVGGTVEAAPGLGIAATEYSETFPSGESPLSTVAWSPTPPYALRRAAPYVSVWGTDPMGFLQQAGQDVVGVTLVDDGQPEMTINDLPEGWEVMVEPRPLPVGSFTAWVSANNTADTEGNFIEVGVRSPLFGMATVGTLDSVDINGTEGWASDSRGYEATWQVDELTYAVVGGCESRDECLTFARSIEFVPVGEWMAHYDVSLPEDFPPVPLNTTATTVTLGTMTTTLMDPTATELDSATSTTRVEGQDVQTSAPVVDGEFRVVSPAQRWLAPPVWSRCRRAANEVSNGAECATFGA